MANIKRNRESREAWRDRFRERWIEADVPRHDLCRFVAVLEAEHVPPLERRDVMGLAVRITEARLLAEFCPRGVPLTGHHEMALLRAIMIVDETFPNLTRVVVAGIEPATPLPIVWRLADAYTDWHVEATAIERVLDTEPAHAGSREHCLGTLLLVLAREAGGVDVRKILKDLDHAITATQRAIGERRRVVPDPGERLSTFGLLRELLEAQRGFWIDREGHIRLDRRGLKDLLLRERAEERRRQKLAQPVLSLDAHVVGHDIEGGALSALTEGRGPDPASGAESAEELSALSHLSVLEQLDRIERELPLREAEMLRTSRTLHIEVDQWGGREHHRRLLAAGFNISQPGLLKMCHRIRERLRSAS